MKYDRLQKQKEVAKVDIIKPKDQPHGSDLRTGRDIEEEKPKNQR
jgi:hypothetical protein